MGFQKEHAVLPVWPSRVDPETREEWVINRTKIARSRKLCGFTFDFASRDKNRSDSVLRDNLKNRPLIEPIIIEVHGVC